MAKGLPQSGSSPALPDSPRGRFAQGVALRTGLNPWVIYAWTLAENNDQSVKRRPYNYLNLKSENGKGAVLGGVRSTNCDKATDGGCFPGFANVDDAVASTVAFIGQHFPGIRRTANKGAGPQLTAISGSGWGTSGGTLRHIYNQILVTVYQGDNLPSVWGVEPSAVPALPGGEELPHEQPSGGILGGLEGIGDFFATVGAAIRLLFSPEFWLRAGQIVAGAVAILAGTVILARGELAGLPVGR